MSNTNPSFFSLGVGVQSSAMYFMASLGMFPVKPQAAIFADPGRERKETYEYFEYMVQWQQENTGIPIYRRSHGNLFEDMMNNSNTTGHRIASIPAYTSNGAGQKEGALRRQCTNEYKIMVVDAKMRELLGLKPRQRWKPINVWIGITTDEAMRMKVPQEKWRTMVYPFCQYASSVETPSKRLIDWPRAMSRNGVITWLKENGFKIPPKSSCTFCPYHGDSTWKDIKKNDPEEWKAIVKVDNQIRNSTKRGIQQPIFLHRSCKAISEVDFGENQGDLFDNCDSGYCFL